MTVKAVKKKDVPALGRRFYEQIRADMEAKQWGRMVVIDVTTGDYEVADDDFTATSRLFERNPKAMTWGELVGYRAAYRMGGNPLAFTVEASPPAND